MTELKNCPFCGNKPFLQNGNNQFPHTEYQYKVHCSFCGGTTCFHANQESAIKTWNTRPIESSLQSKLDIATKALEKIAEITGCSEEQGRACAEFMNETAQTALSQIKDK